MADLDIEVLRSFSDRMAASYEAAQQYAYCPSSEPYRRLMQQAREAKRGLDSCYAAAGVAVAVNPWKEAALDHLAAACMDAPQDEPPYKIIGRIIDWHVAVATDPLVNGGFKLVPIDGVQEAPR